MRGNVSLSISARFERYPWAPPLRVAGITRATVIVSALLVLPGLLHAVDRLRFYDRAVDL